MQFSLTSIISCSIIILHTCATDGLCGLPQGSIGVNSRPSGQFTDEVDCPFLIYGQSKKEEA